MKTNLINMILNHGGRKVFDAIVIKDGKELSSADSLHTMIMEYAKLFQGGESDLVALSRFVSIDRGQLAQAESDQLRAQVAALEAEVERLKVPVALVWHEGSGAQFSQEFEHGQYEIKGNLVAGYYGILRHAKAGVLWLSPPDFVPVAEAKAACEAHHAARFREMQGK